MVVVDSRKFGFLTPMPQPTFLNSYGEWDLDFQPWWVFKPSWSYLPTPRPPQVLDCLWGGRI